MTQIEYGIETFTPEETRRMAEYLLSQEFRMRLSKVREMGLGLGLGDVQEATLDLSTDRGPRLYRLVRLELDPSDPDTVLTRWIEKAT